MTLSEIVHFLTRSIFGLFITFGIPITALILIWTMKRFREDDAKATKAIGAVLFATTLYMAPLYFIASRLGFGAQCFGDAVLWVVCFGYPGVVLMCLKPA